MQLSPLVARTQTKTLAGVYLEVGSENKPTIMGIDYIISILQKLESFHHLTA